MPSPPSRRQALRHPTATQAFPAADLPWYPLFALALASAAAVALDGVRVLVTGQWTWLFLVWNLFLAWIPVGLGLMVFRGGVDGRRWSWKTWSAGVGWLLFFPNAPYIFTDLVHLGKSHPRLYWLDMFLILLFALTGLILGYLSLRLVHEVVARRWGWLRGWLFVGLVAGLSGVGVYIGRFLRWNSWDALMNPLDLLHTLAFQPGLPASRLKFTLLFGTFLFLAYLMLYTLTHFRPATSARLEPTRGMDGLEGC